MRFNVPKVNSESDARSPSALDAKKRFEGEVEAVGRMIEQYRIDGQRFFAGDLPMPPDPLRDRIQGELRRLQSAKVATSADNFRLGTLEGKFQSYQELFGRRLREREQGTGRPAGARAELEHDPHAGVVFGARPAEGAVEALYKGLYMQRGAGTPAMDLDRFSQHLQKQAEAIRAKTGCQDIQFRIAEEDGKLKIKAKPMKGA